MTVEFKLPDVGEGLEEAEIVEWRVAEGDVVTRDQPLVEVLTDKSAVEIPSPVAGRVLRLAGGVGDRVHVGEVLVVLGGEDGTDDVEDTDGTSPVDQEPALHVDDDADHQDDHSASSRNGERGRPATPPSGRAAGRPKAAPNVRRLALEAGVDLATVTGSGPGGRILADDVKAATAAPAAPEARAERSAPTPAPAAQATSDVRLGQLASGTHPLRGIRRATAEAMARSWATIPHIHSADEIDATALLDARRQLRAAAQADGDPRAGSLSTAPFLVAAVAQALRAHPLCNATLDADREEIVVHDGVHVGVAIATPEGLLVAVVRDADRRGLLELAAEIGRLVADGRAGRLQPADARGGTFTVTNYGSLGGRYAAPIIRPGEAGIAGFGAVTERPFVVDGKVQARPTLPVVAGFDHRLVDGDLSIAFTERLKASLSEPLRLLLADRA